MTAPGIVPGGRFFSDDPGSTPKDAWNRGPRRSEHIESMARLFIDVPPEEMAPLLASLPSDTAEVAKAVLFSGDVTQAAAQGLGYFDFLLTSAQHPYQEREQAVDTLTDNTVVYYSGQSAPVFTYSGWLYNTYQDDQNVWFHLLYHDVLRGTQLARRGLISHLRYDSFLVSGYVTGLQSTQSSDVKNAVQFSFMFRVKKLQIVTPILFNPTMIPGAMSSSLFSSDTIADNTTRHGVETAELPGTPRALPAAVASQPDADPRTVADVQGVPAREQQARVDAMIVQQGAAASPAVGVAAAPILSASGDTRQALPAEEAARFQSFSAPDNPANQWAAASSTPLLQHEAEIERQLRAADTRGTAVVSPVTGAVETSGSYADTIARAEVTAAPAAHVPETPPLDNIEDVVQDVRNPPAELLQAVSRGPQDGSSSSQLRSRQRPTG